MKIKKPSDSDFCLCDHEKANNLPLSKTCFFYCPARARKVFAPFLKRLREEIRKNNKSK